MLINASASGSTLDEALAQVSEHLKTAALHAHEVVAKEVAPGVKVIDPETCRVSNPRAHEIEHVVRLLGEHVKPVKGYRIRILAVINEDRENSYARVEVDLVRA